MSYRLGTCDCCEMEEVQVQEYTKKATGEPCDPYCLCEVCELMQADSVAQFSDLGHNLRALAVVFHLMRKELFEVKQVLAYLRAELEKDKL